WFVFTDGATVKRRRGFSVIERIACRQFDRYLIFFRPGVMEINRIFSFAGGKQRIHSSLKKRGLNEDALARSLSITGNPHVVSVSEWLDGILDVLDLHLSDFRSAHAELHAVT